MFILLWHPATMFDGWWNSPGLSADRKAGKGGGHSVVLVVWDGCVPCSNWRLMVSSKWFFLMWWWNPSVCQHVSGPVCFLARKSPGRGSKGQRRQVSRFSCKLVTFWAFCVSATGGNWKNNYDSTWKESKWHAQQNLDVAVPAPYVQHTHRSKNLAPYVISLDYNTYMRVVRTPVYFEMRYIQVEIRGNCDELLAIFPSRFFFRTKMTPKATKEIGTTRSEMLEMIQKYPKMKRSWFSSLVPRFLLKMRSQGLEEKWWWLATGMDFW